jgi:quercetin dioxygenase-like cupin family protein
LTWPWRRCRRSVIDQQEAPVSHVKFEGDADKVVSGGYSAGTGPVVRGDKIEVTRISFAKGKGADIHTHPEEQVMYVLSGRLRVTCGDETYVVGPGEATFNPSDVPHGVMALDDVTALSFKNKVAPI